MTDFQVPPGLICLTTHGSVLAETARCIWEARSFSEANGVKNLAWTTAPASLVDRARNDACRQMLRDPNRGFVLFIDGDATFPPDAVLRILQTAFGSHQWADVVGGYCNLKGDIALPTIDTGTGTWESHYPGSGVKEVIRTGGHFLLVKRHVCERMPEPWFAMRVPMKPIDAFAELDNFARCKMDGANPLRDAPAWGVLEGIAFGDVHGNANWQPLEVGEDSGFCDKVRHHGMRIAVDTAVVTGHLMLKEVNWTDHKKAMAARDLEQRYAVGLLA